MRVEVECETSTGRGAPAVRAFRLGNQRYEVAEIEDRWFGAGESYLRVRTDDGQRYVLRHHEASGAWELAAYTSAARAQLPPQPFEIDSGPGMGRSRH